MARGCTICSSQNRASIEAALSNGDSTRKVANAYAVTQSAVMRHKVNCRVSALTKQVERRAERIDVLANLVLLADDAARAQFAAEREEKWGIVAALIGKRREVLDSIHALQGPEEADRDFTRDPRWLEAWQRVLSALTAYPEARSAVVRALSPPTPRGDSGNPE